VIRDRIQQFASQRKGTPIANLRGLGTMLAFDVVTAHDGGAPDGAAAKRLTMRALEAGLLLLTCGTYGETLRILVPLTITDADLRAGLDTLYSALERGG
jgi:4-aminobutyrate aminotransferase/(S)-3-amino-2-methylpropionate transaminase